jgi:RNA recognition motif-containing protein
MMDFKTNTSKGVGFVTYVRQEDADNAISQMNGKTPEGVLYFFICNNFIILNM